MFGTKREGKPDRRRQPRFPEKGNIRVLWQPPSGGEQIANAKLVDVSENGLRIIVDHMIPVGSYIICNEPTRKISGRGSVRYCVLHRAQYHVGVEFSAGTGWHPAAEESIVNPA